MSSLQPIHALSLGESIYLCDALDKVYSKHTKAFGNNVRNFALVSLPELL